MIAVKAAQIASTKRAEDTFNLDPFKGPSNKIYEEIEIDDIKTEFNANDTTLEIPLVEAESEKENYPRRGVHEVKNKRNLDAPYAVSIFKKKEDITYRIKTKREFREPQVIFIRTSS